MKKKLLMLISIIAISAALCACGNDEKSNSNIQPDVTKIKDDIVATIEFPDMVDANSDNIDLMYSLDADIFDSISVIYAGSGGYADEVTVIKLKSKDDIENVKKVLEGRVADRLIAFEGYAPLETAKLEKAVVKTNGNYVFLAICDDSKKAEKIFDDAFKD